MPRRRTQVPVQRPAPAPISFTKVLDKASPVLMANAVSGMTIPRATLTARKAGAQQQEYLRIELQNVLISSFQTGGSGDAAPSDQFSLNFARMTVEYRPQKADGSLGDPVATTLQGGC